MANHVKSLTIDSGSTVDLSGGKDAPKFLSNSNISHLLQSVKNKKEEAVLLNIDCTSSISKVEGIMTSGSSTMLLGAQPYQPYKPFTGSKFDQEEEKPVLQDVPEVVIRPIIDPLDLIMLDKPSRERRGDRLLMRH